MAKRGLVTNQVCEGLIVPQYHYRHVVIVVENPVKMSWGFGPHRPEAK